MTDVVEPDAVENDNDDELDEDEPDEPVGDEESVEKAKEHGSDTAASPVPEDDNDGEDGE